jgi:nucleotide-binding universal stress UspA family protein
VDGAKPSIAALNTAAAIARRRRCQLHAVTVIAPFPDYRLNGDVDHAHEMTEQLRVALKDSELAVILRMVEPPADWTHDVIVGRAAEVLTEIAESRGAEMLVVGLRDHGVIDRALGDDTAIQVMRTSTVPVLATDRDIAAASVVVVATDFSASSNRAACAAAGLIGAKGRLYLVYADPTPGVLNPVDEIRAADEVASRFRHLITSLRLRDGARAEPIVLTGRPVTAIVDFASRVGAHAIAAGSRGQNRIERMFLGSVSTGLVRESHLPVIVAPPSAGL